MQTVTSAYNAYPDTRLVDARVSFGVIAPEAAATAKHNASPGAKVAQLQQTHNRIEKSSAKYAALEPNLWRLDGSFSLLPVHSETVEVGWWSEALSGEEGFFENPPFVCYDFSSNQKSFGFTLAFDCHLPEQYPSELEASTYNEYGTLVERKTFFPDTWRYVLDMPTQAYRAVKFIFKRTRHPFRRVRLCECTFGVIYEYDKGSMTSLQYEHSIDVLAKSLPSAELSVTVNNASRLYNMANPSGVFAYLQDGQALECSLSIGGEAVSMGKTYFSSAKSTDGSLTSCITANDRIMQLEGKEYGTGSSGTWLLSEAVTAILETAAIRIPVLISAACDVMIRRCIPERTKCREVLRLACQAARCTCYIDRLDRLVFVRPAFGAVKDELTRDRMHGEAQIEISNTFNTVRLTVRDSYANTEEVFVASAIATDDYERADEVENPLVYDGQAVANWLLAGHKRRLLYKLQSRGNPALESLDTIRVEDAYGENNQVLITGQQFSFDGGLDSEVSAVG